MSIYTYNSAKQFCEILNIEFQENPSISDQLIDEGADLSNDKWGQMWGNQVNKGRTPWNKGLPWGEDVREKMSLAKKDCFGDKNNFYGRKHSDATKQLMSSLKKGILTGPCSEEKKANIAKARIGKRWYKNIDSTECVCCYPGQEPAGWIPGMVKKKLETIS